VFLEKYLMELRKEKKKKVQAVKGEPWAQRGGGTVFI